MRKIRIADATLCREGADFRFKEKLEIARLLEKNLRVNVIELPEIENERVDKLFAHTAASFVKNSILSLAVSSLAGVPAALEALAPAEHPRLRVELPLSTVGMEYICHKKPAKMLEYITATVSAAKAGCADVEFTALDATRADREFLYSALNAAVEAGATSVTLCDSAADFMPDEFASFVAETVARISVPVGICADNRLGLAVATAMLSLRAGADCVKCCVSGSLLPLSTFGDLLRDCGCREGLESDLSMTELHRAAAQIMRICGDNTDKEQPAPASAAEEELKLNVGDTAATVSAAVRKLGYDLSAEEDARVFEEFSRVAARKEVGNRELEAIVASVAMQVPETYRLVDYLINSSNVLAASAQLRLSKGDKILQGVSMGDGPIAAAFLALEGIIGRRFELDDLRIQAVTEGKEAVGSALVRLRSGGKLYAGNGISTDIIGAAVRGYLSAVNKIIFEEGEV